MMSDICERDEVDRLPMVITGYGVDQLFCIPKPASAAGENMATAVYNAIQDWKVSENIKSFCFDTNSSNIGLKKGAYTFIKQKLERFLLYLHVTIFCKFCYNACLANFLDHLQEKILDFLQGLKLSGLTQIKKNSKTIILK